MPLFEFKRRSTRRRWLFISATTSLVAVLLFVIGSAVGASLSGSNFEIDTDANLVVNGSAPSIDWLAGGTGSAFRSGVTVKADAPTGATDDSFGQGTKEDSAVPSVVDGSIPPNKSDLKFFGVFKETTASGSFMHLFWSRVQDPQGTTNMDFEFNQSSTLSANGVTPVRTAGDLLILYDLSNGGTVPTLSKRTWTGTAWGPTTPLTGNSIGSINSSSIAANNAGGVPPAGIGAHSPRTFGEASINMSAISPPSGCVTFGSAYLKSRSSDSFTAALKDFIAPEAVSVSNCGIINIHKQDDLGNPLQGAVFTLFNDAAPLDGAAPHGAEDTAVSPAKTCTTNAAGNCSLTNVLFGQYWVVETTTPSGYATADDQNVILSSGSSTSSLTFVDNRLASSVSVKKVDDDSPANPLSGATFTLYHDNAPTGTSLGAEDTITNPALSCNTGAAGTCTISNIFLTGEFWVVETVTPTGYDTAAEQHVTITAGSTNDLTSTPFVNPRNFKVIVLVCQESTGSGDSLYPSAVTIDGNSVGNSISSAQATAAGLTDAQLCGITQADQGGLSHGSHKADPINIPQ